MKVPILSFQIKKLLIYKKFNFIELRILKKGKYFFLIGFYDLLRGIIFIKYHYLFYFFLNGFSFIKFFKYKYKDLKNINFSLLIFFNFYYWFIINFKQIIFLKNNYQKYYKRMVILFRKYFFRIYKNGNINSIILKKRLKMFLN